MEMWIYGDRLATERAFHVNGIDKQFPWTHASNKYFPWIRSIIFVVVVIVFALYSLCVVCRLLFV
jgi:hypothetical protein